MRYVSAQQAARDDQARFGNDVRSDAHEAAALRCSQECISSRA